MSHLTDIIQAEIALRGVIPFARFMELALYCPEYGYYEKESDTVGRGGDFYTSVSVGPLFGQLLASQFAEWLMPISATKLQIVEAGAHDGKLAADILEWLRQERPQLFAKLEYVIIEPSNRRRAWQKARLAHFAPKVRWQDKVGDAQQAQFGGVIFANELLDAMPVHRVGWDAQQQQWFEWGVTQNHGQFAWKRMAAVTADLAELDWVPAELRRELPNYFTVEICPAARNWWREVAQSLQKGFVLTLDYGLRREDFVVPGRAQGTLRAYRDHRRNDDLLADPGEQDLTAHVNFSAIQEAGEAAGLKTELFQRQAEFLVQIASRHWSQAAGPVKWGPKQNRQLQTLIHPEHLGRAFQVLVQSR